MILTKKVIHLITATSEVYFSIYFEMFIHLSYSDEKYTTFDRQLSRNCGTWV